MPLSETRAECAVGAQSMPSSAEFALSSRVVPELTQRRVRTEAESAHNQLKVHFVV